VIVKAVRKNWVVAEDVAADGSYPIAIWPKLRSILAAPIRDLTDADCDVLGTLSFDSAQTLAENHFDDPAAEEICKIVATCVYCILREG
jgi:hypothetical protein